MGHCLLTTVNSLLAQAKNSTRPMATAGHSQRRTEERLMIPPEVACRADQLNRISPQVRIKHHQLLKRAFGPHQTTTFAAKQRADLMSHQGSPAPWSCPKLGNMPPAVRGYGEISQGMCLPPPPNTSAAVTSHSHISVTLTKKKKKKSTESRLSEGLTKLSRS